MKKKPKPLKDLNLTSRFLFDEVMEDVETLECALSIIWGREVPLLLQPETEKELRVSPLLRSIRLDVVTMDTEGTVYSTEMQDERKNDLAKRSRYYQALVDTNLLEPGIPNYNLLNATYIIMITTFDLFGYGKYQYTFRSVCEEEPECILGDKAVRLFLNTRGTNEEEVSKELVKFLHYIEDTTDKAAEEAGSEHIKRIHERVRKVRESEKVGVKYMQAWEERYYEFKISLYAVFCIISLHFVHNSIIIMYKRRCIICHRSDRLQTLEILLKFLSFVMQSVNRFLLQRTATVI